MKILTGAHDIGVGTGGRRFSLFPRLLRGRSRGPGSYTLFMHAQLPQDF